MINYEKTNWRNGSGAPINAANLNKMEQGIKDACDGVDSLQTEVGSLKADYIVEQGTSGEWTYRKWNSGIAECWFTNGYATTPVPTTMTSNGSIYESNIMQFAMPSGLFIQVPCKTVTAVAGGGMWLKAAGGGETTYLQLTMLRTNNTKAAVNFGAYLIGWWK